MGKKLFKSDKLLFVVEVNSEDAQSFHDKADKQHPTQIFIGLIQNWIYQFLMLL